MCTLMNEEQIIGGDPIDGAMGSSSVGRVGSYQWFVYIATLLLREASWLLYCIVGHSNPASAPSILLVLLELHFKATRPQVIGRASLAQLFKIK